MRALDELCREIDTTDMDALLVKVTCNMTRAASQIAYRAKIADTCCETVEKLPIKWLMLQLIEDASDVFVRYSVVAGLDLHTR